MADQHLHDDQLVALALDDVDGAGRAELVQHLSGCGRCRNEYDGLAATLEQTLTAAPAVEPPPGFDSRVLAALGVDRPEHRALRPRAAGSPSAPRWRVAVAAVVAGIALGAGGVGLWAMSQDPPRAVAATSFLTTPDGAHVGTVTRTLVGGRPALVVTVTDGKVGMDYLCALRLEDGRRVDVATWEIGSDQSHSWVVPTTESVAQVLLVAEAGAGPVWSSATL